MDINRTRLRRILASVGMTYLEEDLKDILENEHYDYDLSFKNASSDTKLAKKVIRQIAESKLNENETELLNEMIDLYIKCERELFFEMGFILGWKKENSPLY
ncbi:MAG: hypothetical protein IJN62_04410 [Clostridia bacterium]|nr:hypothetical protein [Clostridia bacterium]